MDVDPKAIIELIGLNLRERRNLKRLSEAGKLRVARIGRTKDMILLGSAEVLKLRGFAVQKAIWLELTELGKCALWYLEMLEKVEVLVARFPPCEACERTSGIHHIMCPIGLGIIKSKT